jgi:hypothetical protein
MYKNSYWTYYCEKCDKFHHGHRGVCTRCGYPSDWDTQMHVTKERAIETLNEYPTEEEWVHRRLLKGIGPLNKPWTNEKALRLFYRRCIELFKNKCL